MKTSTVVIICSTVFAHGLVIEQSPAKTYPVSKVVSLIKDMKAQLERDADNDEEIYNKLSCWCETNDKGKTKAIDDANKRIGELDETVEKLAAANQTLLLEIKAGEKEVAQNQEALDKATAMREKAHEEFIAEEKEMVQSIKALHAAIVVLSKHHGKSALLSDRKVMASVIAAAHAAFDKHSALLEGVITPSQKRLIASMLQQGQPDYFQATPTFKQEYQPQGGEIFGILSQMKETFDQNLKDSQEEETAAMKEFEDIKAAKEQEIALGKANVEDKTEQLAAAVEGLAEAKQERDDTYEALGADKKFLMELKLKCSMTDKDWEDRKKMRAEEIEAMTKALEILTTDEARELFSRTFNDNTTSFLQVSQGVKQQNQEWRRQQAKAVLAAAAKMTGTIHGSAMAALSVAVTLDPFTRVKKAIDDMVAQLLAEKADEIKHRDWCTGEFNANELATEKETHTKESLETKIGVAERRIKEITAVITGLEDEITEMNKQMNQAKVDREQERKQFFVIQKDQQDTINILNEVLAMFQKVYARKAVTETALQTKQEPPKGFSEYKLHGGAMPVIGLIQNIIANAQAMEVETQKDEQDSQDAYTQFKEETTKAIEVKNAAIVDRKSDRAEVEDELLQLRTELDGTITELQKLASTKGGLHKACDFIMTNFEARQSARDGEVEALRNAKSFLSGMKPDN